MLSKNNKKRKYTFKKLIFPIIMLGYPIIQVLIFYFGVNINSILLAFKTYITEGANTYATFCGLDNFKQIFKEFTYDKTYYYSIRNSIIVLLISLIIITPLSTLFSYYVYKNHRFSKLFKVLLVLPMITSSLVMVLTYTKFVDVYLPKLLKKVFDITIPNMISNTHYQFYSLAFYMILVGFGTSSLLYIGAMNTIDPEMIEAGKIDGVTPFKEFIYLIIPSIYPTFSTLIIITVAGLFTNQFNLFSFFGKGAQPTISTVGYDLYKATKDASVAEYPILAAKGILCTIVVVTLTFLVRNRLNKFDPMGNK